MILWGAKKKIIKSKTKILPILPIRLPFVQFLKKKTSMCYNVHVRSYKT